MPLSIVLANEFELVRKGVLSVLQSDSELQVVGEGSNVHEFLTLVTSKCPHSVIVDLPMTNVDILEVMKEIKRVSPQTRVLVLSGYPAASYLRKLLAAGIAGYVLRTGPTSDLIAALHSSDSPIAYVSPALKPLLANGKHTENSVQTQRLSLSPRQSEVLRLIAQGLSSKEIGVRLGIAECTVKTHRKTIMERLEIHDKVNLMRYAMTTGLIRPHEEVL